MELLPALVKILAADIPEYRSREISDFAEITGGWETKIYSFALTGPDSPDGEQPSFVLRQFFGPDQDHKARAEADVLRRARQAGIRVPQVFLTGDRRSPLGTSFILMEKIEGEGLGTKLQGGSRELIKQCLRRMAAVLACLHALDPEEVFPGQPTTRPQTLKTALTELRDTRERYQIQEFAAVEHWLQDHQPETGDFELAVTHNDFHVENLVVQRSSDEIYTLDWSFAGVNDYRLDLAWTLLLVGTMVGVKWRDFFLEAYTRAAGRPVPHMDFFEGLKLAHRTLTLLTWLDERVEIPVHKIDREALRGEYRVHVLNVYERLKALTQIELTTLENL